MTWTRLKKIATGWHVWVLPVLYILWVSPEQSFAVATNSMTEYD